MNEDYMMWFADGFQIGLMQDITNDGFIERVPPTLKKASKRKVKQSPKQKLLTKMTAAKWNKYKKGRGKKTYVEIRAEVSRSQAFKKKAKRL